jgi:two-component system sensor histidine kinase VicK
MCFNLQESIIMMTNPSEFILSLAEHDAHACFVYNVDIDAFAYANPAFYSFFGLAGKDLCAKFILSKIHPDDVESLKQKYFNMQPNVLNRFDFRLQLPDGNIHLIQASVLIDTSEDKQDVVTGYVIDLTNLRNNNALMEKTKNMNKEAINKFTHELAGILASIQTYTLLLSRKTKGFQDEEINNLLAALNQLSKDSVHLIRSYNQNKYIERIGEDMINNTN